MKDILIITHFYQAPFEEGNGRFNYIAEKLSDFNSVEVVTSSFSHIKKKQRLDQSEFESKYKLTYISEPGYFKNVSIKRLYSHMVMAKNLSKYLKKRKKPDVVYCAVPSLSVGLVAAKFCKKNSVKFIIDIQDLWPEAFGMVNKIPGISPVLFSPLKQVADFIYSSADSIVGVSKTYCERAVNVNPKVNRYDSVFLGTELDEFDEFKKMELPARKDQNSFLLAYIGTLGHSYDLTCVLNALAILKRKGLHGIKFIVMGDGPLKDKFEKLASSLNLNVQFTGRLKYSDMVSFLCGCDVAVNPITQGAAQSIINKVGDYAAAGLPVINTQECQEYRTLVSDYGIGYNCKNNDPDDLALKILDLYNSPEIRVEMGKNNRKLAEVLFDRKISYKKILRLLG